MKYAQYLSYSPCAWWWWRWW